MTDESRKTLEELLAQKQRLLEEHTKVKPEEVPEPTSELTNKQQEVAEQLTAISQELEELQQQQESNREEITKLAAKKKSCKNIKAGFEIVKRAVSQFTSEFNSDADLLGLDVESLIKLEIDEKAVSDFESASTTRGNELKKVNCHLMPKSNFLQRRRLH